MRTLIYNGQVITPFRIIRDGHLLIENGAVVYAGKGPVSDILAQPGIIAIDAGGDYIAPGFIDIHTHGGGGVDFMDGRAESMLHAARTHLQYGTTTLLPSTVGAPTESYWPAFDAFAKAKADPREADGAHLYGIHMEGPYFNPEQKGAMLPEYLRNPDPAEYLPMLERCPDIVRWSCAPELPGAYAFARECAKHNVVVSMGHTMAIYDQAIEAFENGFTLCTHLYSAMGPMRRIEAMRYSGAVETAFVTENLDVEIIADGVHLPLEILRLIVQNKGCDRIALITDSMRAAGEQGTESVLGDGAAAVRVIIEDGVAKLADRSALAGSIATADRLIRTMYCLADIPLCDTVRMMTDTPARIIGIKNKGRLTPGYDADVVIFDRDIHVKTVLRSGAVKYTA